MTKEELVQTMQKYSNTDNYVFLCSKIMFLLCYCVILLYFCVIFLPNLNNCKLIDINWNAQ